MLYQIWEFSPEIFSKLTRNVDWNAPGNSEQLSGWNFDWNQHRILWNQTFAGAQQTDEFGKMLCYQAGLGAFYNNIGAVCFLKEQPDLQDIALEFYQKSLQQFEEANEQTGIATVSYNISLFYATHNTWVPACKYVKTCNRNLTKMNDQPGLSVVRRHLGLLYANKGDKEKALRIFENNKEMFEAPGAKRQLGWFYNIIGDLYSEEVDIQSERQALKYYKKSKRILQKIEDEDEEVEVKEALATTYSNLSAFYANSSLFSNQKKLDCLFDAYNNKKLDLLKELDLLEVNKKRKSELQDNKKNHQRFWGKPVVIPVGFVYREEDPHKIDDAQQNRAQLLGKEPSMQNRDNDSNEQYLPFDLQERIVEFLTSLPNVHDESKLRALVYGATLEPDLENQIRFGLPPVEFFQLLIRTLSNYGMLRDGRNALNAVLESAKVSVGQPKRDRCSLLIQEVEALRGKIVSTD